MKRLIATLGWLITWGVALWPLIWKTIRLALDTIGLAGIPGDLKTWQEVLPDMSDPLIILVILVGFGCLIYATSGIWRQLFKDRLMGPRRSGISGILLDGNGVASKGISAKGVSVDLEDVGVVGVTQTAIELENAPDSVVNAWAKGNHRRGTIGFDIADSPRVDMSEAKATNFETGFRVKRSADVDLSKAKAKIEPDDRASGRKYYPVKLPDGMKSPDGEKGGKSN